MISVRPASQIAVCENCNGAYDSLRGPAVLYFVIVSGTIEQRTWQVEVRLCLTCLRELGLLATKAGVSRDEVVALKGGVYRHYKGKHYLVLGQARHSETGEIFVVYVPLYDVPDNKGVQMAVRPLLMFIEQVELEGPDGPTTVPRFTPVEQEGQHGRQE